MNPFTDLLDFNDKDSYITLLTSEGLTEQEAEDAFEALKAVYDKYQTVFDNLYFTRHGQSEEYHVKETDAGPRVSQSRAMVYDIFEYWNQGATRGEIALSFNLKLAQVDVALEYIKLHQEALEVELGDIKEQMPKDEAKYRAVQQEIEKRVQALPMTRERKAFYKLKEKNRGK